MQAHAAVFRTGSVLAEGCQKIDDIYNRTEDLKVHVTSLLIMHSLKRSSWKIFKAVAMFFTNIYFVQAMMGRLVFDQAFCLAIGH